MLKMSKLNLISLLLIFVIILTGCDNRTTHFQESTSKSSKEITDKLVKVMQKYPEFSGTVLVAKGEEVLLNRGYGMADYDKKIVNEPQNVLEIGSITKQFTATAILMLQEKKLLNVQDTVSKYIPDYPNGDKIKIYNLLTQTSGIPEYLSFVESVDSGKNTYTPIKLIEIFKDKPLNFEVGTSFQYSNSNYILLGYIIEIVSGMRYEDYLEENIFKPLEMNSSGFLSNLVEVKDKAIGYSILNIKLNKYEKASESEPTLPYSAGEIYSTVEDLYIWNNALFTEKLIKKDSLNEMLNINKGSYGYGWFIFDKSNGDKLAYHGGATPGYSSLILRDVNSKYVIIILSNRNHDYNVDILRNELLGALDD
jgi:CubicO group peptidase (beta-lactamase class C family)